MSMSCAADLRSSVTRRRILMANWLFKAVQKALQGDAKRKHLDHAGALLTANGTDDELFKLEGTCTPTGSQRGYRIQL